MRTTYQCPRGRSALADNLSPHLTARLDACSKPIAVEAKRPSIPPALPLQDVQQCVARDQVVGEQLRGDMRVLGRPGSLRYLDITAKAYTTEAKPVAARAPSTSPERAAFGS